MKKMFGFIMVAAMAANAYAVDVLYVNGAETQTINGVACPGWTIANPLEVPLKDGVYTIKVENFQNFHISTAKAESDSEDWNLKWNPNQIGIESDWLEPCKEMTIIKKDAGFDSKNAGNFIGGSYTFTISKDLMTLKVTPDVIYLAGSKDTQVNGINQNEWDINNPLEIRKGDDGMFRFEIMPANEYQDISVFKGSGNWGVWDAGKYNAAITEEGVETPLVHNSDRNNVSFPEIGKKYVVEIAGDMSNIKARNLDGVVTGIQEVLVEGTRGKEYYNLQGIRVINPMKGEIYIVRSSNKSSKVVF